MIGSYLIKHFSQANTTDSLFDNEDLLKSGINRLSPVSKEICKNTLAVLPKKIDPYGDFKFVLKVFSKIAVQTCAKRQMYEIEFENLLKTEGLEMIRVINSVLEMQKKSRRFGILKKAVGITAGAALFTLFG
jgi:hypothetical protein